MAKTCFVCELLHLEMTNIFQHPKNLDLILKELLGLEAKQDDYLCLDCCGELINAFEAKKIFNQSNPERLESPSDNEVIFEEESNEEFEIETIILEIPVVKIEQENEGELGTNFAEMTAETDATELLEQLETAEAEAPQRVYATEKSHVCSDCGKSLISASNLKKHKKIHSGEKPHVCPHCARGFTFKRGLEQHLRIHTKEKPFACPVCGKKFAYSAGLTVHKRTHTGEKPYICRYCPKTFTFSSNLRAHVLVHLNQKSFVCSDCGKGFNNPTTLKVHRRTHTGEKPFACSDCSRAFHSNRDLNRHKRIHTEETPFTCLYCPKAFKNRFERLLHIRSMHQKEINSIGCKENHQSSDEAVEKNETDQTEIVIDQTEIVISKSESELEISESNNN